MMSLRKKEGVGEASGEGDVREEMIEEEEVGMEAGYSKETRLTRLPTISTV